MENLGTSELQLIAQSALTIIGWFITAWWAIVQVNKAHQNSSNLQRKLLQDSHRQYLAKELNESYKSAMSNIDEFTQSLMHMVISYGIAERTNDKPRDKTSEQIREVYEAQSSMSCDIKKLQVWLETISGTLESACSLQLALDKYDSLFTVGHHQESFENIPWMKFHNYMMAIEANKAVSYKELSSEASQLVSSLNKVSEELKEIISSVNSALCGFNSQQIRGVVAKPHNPPDFN